MIYWYITYTTAVGGIGQYALRQLPGGEGFNLASSHKFMEDRLGLEILILNWVEISERRYQEFVTFLDSKDNDCGNPNCPRHAKPKPAVLQGGGEKTEPRGKLQVVPKEEPPKA